MATGVITARSVPVYDVWEVEDWIAWHKVLVGAYGIEEANRKFLAAYRDAPFGLKEPHDVIAWRTLSTPFRNYAKANGFYDGLFWGIGGYLARFLTLFTGSVEAVSGTVENASTAVQTTLKTANVVLPIALVILVGGGLFFLYQKFIAGSK